MSVASVGESIILTRADHACTHVPVGQAAFLIFARRASCRPQYYLKKVDYNASGAPKDSDKFVTETV